MRTGKFNYAGHAYNCTVLRCGQPRPYADHCLEISIKTDCPYEDVVLEAIQNDVPRKGAAFDSACKLLGAGAYFRGYCDIVKVQDGYVYTKIEPFTD